MEKKKNAPVIEWTLENAGLVSRSTALKMGVTAEQLDNEIPNVVGIRGRVHYRKCDIIKAAQKQSEGGAAL